MPDKISADKEYKLESSTREVIERQLLMTLVGGNQVAILATKEDLQTFINALDHYVIKITLRREDHERAKSLLEGARKLMAACPWGKQS